MYINISRRQKMQTKIVQTKIFNLSKDIAEAADPDQVLLNLFPPRDAYSCASIMADIWKDYEK